MSTLSSEFDLQVAPEGMAFFLENMGADASPTQFIRELTQNSIEAVSRANAKGKILWTIDQGIYDGSKGKQSKLTIIDNGDGMTGEEMAKYIRQLASSSSEKSQTGNFGIGAKITAGVKNSHGLVYISWKNGTASKIHFWKNPETGKYGLKPLLRRDGTTGLWTDIVDCEKPKDIIGDHGTKVVLLGESENDNTSQPPANFEFGETDWIARYLESHYADIPDDIELRVSNVPSNAFKDGILISGRFSYFDKNAENKGTVSLDGVKAHWWLLGDVKQNTPVENKGHVGVLFQDELYDVRMRRSGHALLNQAGIIAGPDRVVLYFEPLADIKHTVKPSSSRGNVMVNGRPVPLADWVTSFSEGMPKILRAYVTDQLREAPEDAARRLRQRLEGVSDLFRSSAFKRSHDGEDVAEQSDAMGSQELPKKEKHGGGLIGSEPNPEPDEDAPVVETLGKLLKEKKDKADADENGHPAKKAKGLVIPSTKWVSGEHDQELEDRAAKYDARSNQILINKDFRGYNDLLKHIGKEYPSAGNVRVALEHALDEFYSQVLVQAVLGVKGLSEKGAHLKSEYNALLLSPEALTTAVMVRAEIRDNVVGALRKEGIKPLPKKQQGKTYDS